MANHLNVLEDLEIGHVKKEGHGEEVPVNQPQMDIYHGLRTFVRCVHGLVIISSLASNFSCQEDMVLPRTKDYYEEGNLDWCGAPAYTMAHETNGSMAYTFKFVALSLEPLAFTLGAIMFFCTLEGASASLTLRDWRLYFFFKGLCRLLQGGYIDNFGNNYLSAIEAVAGDWLLRGFFQGIMFATTAASIKSHILHATSQGTSPQQAIEDKAREYFNSLTGGVLEGQISISLATLGIFVGAYYGKETFALVGGRAARHVALSNALLQAQSFNVVSMAAIATWIVGVQLADAMQVQRDAIDCLKWRNVFGGGYSGPHRLPCRIAIAAAFARLLVAGFLGVVAFQSPDDFQPGWFHTFSSSLQLTYLVISFLCQICVAVSMDMFSSNRHVPGASPGVFHWSRLLNLTWGCLLGRVGTGAGSRGDVDHASH